MKVKISARSEFVVFLVGIGYLRRGARNIHWIESAKPENESHTIRKLNEQQNTRHRIQGSYGIFGELIKIYCYCQKKNDNAFKRTPHTHTHRLSISPVRRISSFSSYQKYLYVFIIATYKQHLFMFVSGLCVCVFFPFVWQTSSFSFIRLVDENGWKNVFSAICKCSKVSSFTIFACMRYNFIRWNIIIFCSTPNIFRSMCAVGYFLCECGKKVKYIRR